MINQKEVVSFPVVLFVFNIEALNLSIFKLILLVVRPNIFASCPTVQNKKHSNLCFLDLSKRRDTGRGLKNVQKCIK
jgi:hypothetical protein